MVRKDEMGQFFEKKKLPNSSDSYLSSQFSSVANAYQFSNVAQLITNLKIERDLGAGIEKGDSEATRNAKYQAWELKNPNWNKVMLIPVAVKHTTTTNYYGQIVKTLQSVRHQLGLTSARIEGGKNSPLKVEVIYSRYSRQSK